jgi:hypothetical protein
MDSNGTENYSAAQPAVKELGVEAEGYYILTPLV